MTDKTKEGFDLMSKPLFMRVSRLQKDAILLQIRQSLMVLGNLIRSMGVF